MNKIKAKKKEEKEDEKTSEQGRIHGHQLRTGGQGRKCAFSLLSTCVHKPTDQPTNGWMDRWTDGQSLL